MQTIIIYDQCGEAPLSFYVVDSDRSHLDGTYVNKTENNEANETELLSIVEDEELTGTFHFPEGEMGPETKVIICGFLP